MSKDLVSIIIPTLNETKNLPRLFDSIKNQLPKVNVEVIVVDNSSQDDTVKLSRKFTKKVYTHGPERSAQRNFGASKAKGNFLLFLDADMELTPKVVWECINISKSKNLSAVVIPEVSIVKTFWEKVKAYERSFYNESGDDQTDAARFFAKKIFHAVGGYDETLTGPEDWDLPETIKKHGGKIGRVTAQIKHYEKVPNPLKLARKKFYYALKAHRYLTKHGISPVSGKTIYFLRPVFYKQWQKLISNPLMTIAMFTMFGFELIGGGIGFMYGKFKHL